MVNRPLLTILRAIVGVRTMRRGQSAPGCRPYSRAGSRIPLGFVRERQPMPQRRVTSPPEATTRLVHVIHDSRHDSAMAGRQRFDGQLDLLRAVRGPGVCDPRSPDTLRIHEAVPILADVNHFDAVECARCASDPGVEIDIGECSSTAPRRFCVRCVESGELRPDRVPSVARSPRQSRKT